MPEFLPAELHGAPLAGSPPAAPHSEDVLDWQRLPRWMETWLSAGEMDLYRRGLEYFDRLVIRRAMDQAGGNQARAAEILGLSRVTLRAKLRALGMNAGKVVTQADEE